MIVNTNPEFSCLCCTENHLTSYLLHLTSNKQELFITMKDMKKTVAFLFFLLAGIVLGTAVGKLCAGVSFLSWLAYTLSLGLGAASPVTLDLIVFKLSFGFELNVNAAQIIFVVAALILYSKTCKGG